MEPPILQYEGTNSSAQMSRIRLFRLYQKDGTVDMINITDRNITIGSITAQLPQAAGIFKNYGIDYCCGGNRKLADVIREQDITEKEIYHELLEAEKARKDQYQHSDFTAMSPLVLSSYIEDTHHGYLRRLLPETSEILNTILRVHGRNHPELFEVYRLFGTLRADLEQHLLKEETLLFPAFSNPEDAKDEITRLTTDIIREHVAAGDILNMLRTATRDYTVQEDACGTFARAYEMLMELEEDLHQHIHLENNVLLKDYDSRNILQ